MVVSKRGWREGAREATTKVHTLPLLSPNLAPPSTTSSLHQGTFLTILMKIEPARLPQRQSTSLRRSRGVTIHSLGILGWGRTPFSPLLEADEGWT